MLPISFEASMNFNHPYLSRISLVFRVRDFIRPPTWSCRVFLHLTTFWHDIPLTTGIRVFELQAFSSWFAKKWQISRRNPFAFLRLSSIPTWTVSRLIFRYVILYVCQPEIIASFFVWPPFDMIFLWLTLVAIFKSKWLLLWSRICGKYVLEIWLLLQIFKHFFLSSVASFCTLWAFIYSTI